MMSRNVICGVKFGRFWTFDRRRPSWILRKMKNSSAGLFLGSSSMSMPNFVWIRWTGSKLLQKILRGSNTLPPPPPHPPPHPPVKKQFIELPTFQVGAKNTFFITLHLWWKTYALSSSYPTLLLSVNKSMSLHVHGLFWYVFSNFIIALQNILSLCLFPL